ncbi:MAG: NAD-dependent epimerase/dehydratase family protein [Promethearchaeota archaeon]
MASLRVLVTGGFGSVGAALLDELVDRGHAPVVFELDNKRNRRAARKRRSSCDVVWGDISDPDSVGRAVRGVDTVVHLAGIIPPLSEINPGLCHEVNVVGSRVLLGAVERANGKGGRGMGRGSSRGPGFVFVSSASVMGPTQDRKPPISPYDPPNPTTNYTHSKVAVEQMLRETSVNHCTCRLGAVLSSRAPFKTGQVGETFNINLENRVEMVLDLDVATALARAAELVAAGESLNGKILNIGGGGGRGFQGYGRDLTNKLFEEIGIGALDERCFTNEDYFLDWMDTRESQALLDFQKHDFDEAISLFVKPLRKFRPFIKLVSRTIRKRLERKSPRFRQGCEQ